jgi:Peptidase C13 family
LIGFTVLILQTLLNGFSLLRFRQKRKSASADASVVVLTSLCVLTAEGVRSYLTNGHPGHIEWLALPDLTFPLVLLGLSCWAVTALLGQKSALPELIYDVLSARFIMVLMQLLALGLQQKFYGAALWDAFPEGVQAFTEVWCLLAVMVRMGHLSDADPFKRKYLTIQVWGIFLVPWLFWLSLFQSADLWQTDGEDSDPKHYAQAMTEDTFTAESLMFEGMLDSFEADRPGEEDMYFLGVSGEAGNPLYLREAELALETLRDVYGIEGRAGILANHANNTARYPFATHNNFEASLNRIAELIDAEEDVLFLFLSSRGTQSPSLVLSQPGLILADMDPKGIKKALDDAQIKWRIIVISACYSGAFINQLADSKTLIMTSSDATDQGLGCAKSKDSTWFTQLFFEEGLKKSLGMTAAFNATVDTIKKQQGMNQTVGLPQMVMGAEMKHKLALLESRVLQPGALKDGLRARSNWPRTVRKDYAGISGVRESSKAWMVSFNRSLRFLSRTRANSSISAATL